MDSFFSSGGVPPPKPMRCHHLPTAAGSRRYLYNNPMNPLDFRLPYELPITAVAADIDALCRLVACLSVFAATFRDVREIELNPVLVHPAGKGCTIVDALLATWEAKEQVR